METYNAQTIKKRIEELEKRREEIAKENINNWDSLTQKDKYNAKQIENIRRNQQIIFSNFIKNKYPLYIDHELEYFSEFFQLWLESKVKNMVDYMQVKVGLNATM